MENKEVDIYGFAETNVAWNPERVNQVRQHGRGRFTQFKLVTSSSDDPSIGYKQPGGTCMGVTGAYVGRVSESGEDPHGLGRWSYVSLAGQNDRKLYVVSAYRVSQDHNSTGDATAHKQQMRLLRQRGINNPNPRKQWCDDLLALVETWIAEGAEVLIMADANSPLNDKGFGSFVARSKLYDILGAKHGMNSPSTYLRGSNTIDFMLGTERVSRAVIFGGMLRFKDRIHSDHRGLYLDLNVLYVFRGEIHAINKVVTRNLITKHRARARKYRQA
eukprot:scaffold6986_cov35-Attheya_sp.AAC.1